MDWRVEFGREGEIKRVVVLGGRELTEGLIVGLADARKVVLDGLIELLLYCRWECCLQRHTRREDRRLNNGEPDTRSETDSS